MIASHARLISFGAALLLASPASAAVPDLNFTVAMSEPVVVTGCPANCPRLVLDVGGVTRYANFASGSGTASLTFAYSPVAGDVDLDGISITSTSIDLNTSGTISDLNANALSPLTFTPPVTTGLKINYPSLSLDFVNGRYTSNGTATTSLAIFLSTTSGSFTRASTATYFDSSGILQTAAVNTPRFDYDPTTLTLRGLLLEEGRTNYVKDSQATSLSVGFNSTNANWQTYCGNAAMPGCSVTVVGTGSQYGIPYVDVRFLMPTNISGSSTWPYFGMSSASNISVVSGDKTIASAWLGTIAYTAVGGTCPVYLSSRSYKADTSYLTEQSVAYTGLAPYTYRKTPVLTHGATAGLSNSYIYITVAAGASCDVTIRLGGYQYERGDFATSYIPTSGAIATRAVENFIIPTGSWHNATASTLVGHGASNGVASGSSSTLADLDNNNWNQRFHIRLQGGPAYGSIITDTAVQTSLSGAGYTFGTFAKVGMAGTTNNAALYAAGALIGTDATLTMPLGVTQMRVGSVANGAEYINGWLKSLQYYPARVTNTQLQLLTQ